MGVMRPVRPSSILVGAAAFVVLSAPGAECFVARRRHHRVPTSYNNVGDTYASLEPQQGLIREESSIPGVSIWTSKASSSSSAVAAAAAAGSRNPTTAPSSSGDDLRPKSPPRDSDDDTAVGLSGAHQVRKVNLGCPVAASL